MTIELADLTSYFQEVLILDYYDGPMAGVGLLPDRSAYYFKIVGWDKDQLERVFGIAAISALTANQLWDAFRSVEPPRQPTWWPQSGGSGDIAIKIRGAISAVCSEAERTGPTRLIQSRDLIGPTKLVMLDTTQVRMVHGVMFSDKWIDLGEEPLIEELLRHLARHVDESG
jgi:hypothetical protein